MLCRVSNESVDGNKGRGEGKGHRGRDGGKEQWKRKER